MLTNERGRDSVHTKHAKTHKSTAAPATKQAPLKTKVSQKQVQVHPAVKRLEQKQVVKTAKEQPNRANRRQMLNGGIPRGRATQGLHLPNDQSKRSFDIQKRLKAKSPWFTSIQDPLRGADAKIPDMTGVDTGTLQLIQRTSTQANAAGQAGCRIMTPYANLCATGGASSVNYQLSSSTSTGVALAWQAGLPFLGVEDLQAITNQHRVVSAAMYITPECSLASNQGEMCGSVREWTLDTIPTYIQYTNRYKAVTAPVNANKPLVIRWFPTKRSDGESTNGYDLFYNTNLTNFQPGDGIGCPGWDMTFLAIGLDPTCVFQITIVINYEFIPIFNTLNVLSASPSPVDLDEEALVEGWIDEMPVTQLLTQRQVASSPQTVSPQHGENDEGTGFGMFFNIMSELLPMALAIL